MQWIYNGDGFNVVSGLYYYNEDLWSFGGAVAPDFFVPLAPGVFFPFPIINAGERVQENTSTAVYVNGTFAVNEKLNLTLGARYTDESKDAKNTGEEFFGTGITSAEGMEQAFGTGVGFGITGYEASESWTSFTPKIVLDYQYSDATMYYISAAEGFKSGGFNGRLTAFAQPFDPETLWSYEIGSKSLLNNDRIRLNTAIFYNDYENFQLSRFSIDPATGAFLSLFENAGQVTTYGAELEMQAVATDNLNINFNVGYLGGGYDELIGDFDLEISDEAELVNAPRWNGRLGMEYFVAMNNGSNLSFRASVAYRSKTYLTASSSEILAQSGFSLWDASMLWVSADDIWQGSLFVKNVTDEEYREHGFDLSASPGVQLGYYGAPRTFGANLTYRF
jgi:iron complex outermembrane receptor protein